MDIEHLTSYAFETITVASASIATGFTETKWNIGGVPPKFARVYVNPGPNIRFTLDGTTVTTGTGIMITAFMTYDVGVGDMRSFRTTSSKVGTTGSIAVNYMR